jgi:hypothetical protein
MDEVHIALPAVQHHESAELEFQDPEIREWNDLFLRDLPAQQAIDEAPRPSWRSARDVNA